MTQTKVMSTEKSPKVRSPGKKRKRKVAAASGDESAVKKPKAVEAGELGSNYG